MVRFISFKSGVYLKDFFGSIKKETGVSWKILSVKIGISRRTLEGYRLNQSKIPFEVYNKLLMFLQKDKRKEVSMYIEEIDSSTWLSKGGKRAYKINYNQFEVGRKKGLLRMRDFRMNKERETASFHYDLNKELCLVMGAFIGDGFFNCYNNKLYQIEFAGDSRYDLEYYDKKIIPVLKSLIPELNPRIYFVKNKNSIRVVFYSKRLFFFLKEEFCFKPGKKAHTIKIPKKIICSGNCDFINSTIRGIFDTDGCVFIDKRDIYKSPYARISFTTVSYLLYLQLVDYLSKDYKLYTYENPKRNAYIIEIYGKAQIKKWMSKIGFSNPRHLNKIASVA